MSKKMLYIASTVGHLKSFHLPYLERFAQEGWTVHIAGKNAHQLLPGAEEGFEDEDIFYYDELVNDKLLPIPFLKVNSDLPQGLYFL